MTDRCRRDAKFGRCALEAQVAAAPVIDKEKRKEGIFSRSDFTFEEGRNLYICPAAQVLTTTGHITADNSIRYSALIPVCRVCPLKQQCCPTSDNRRLLRDVYEKERDIACALATTAA